MADVPEDDLPTSRIVSYLMLILRLDHVVVVGQSELEPTLGKLMGAGLRDDSLADGVKCQFRNAF